MNIHIEHPALPKGAAIHYDDAELCELSPGEVRDLIDDHVSAVRSALRPMWLTRLLTSLGLA